ncbi:MAG: hypothetical protein H7145_19785 [Akkermansiaceae bacterium]|nr:hypothetical protein [Armatimonadota bacterium]
MLSGSAMGQSHDEKLLTPEQGRADIAFAFQTLRDVHPNLYAWIPEGTIARERVALEKSLTAPLTRKEFWLRFTPLIARLRDGHTWLPVPVSIWGEYRDTGANLFPLDTRINGEKMFVKADYGEATQLAPGTEIVAINGIPVRTILDHLMPYANAELLPARWNQIANSLRSSLYLNLGISAPFIVTYAPPGGKPVVIQQPGVSWKTIVAKRESTQKAAGGETYYRYRLLREDNIGLIEYDRCTDLPKFETFLKETFSQIQKDKPRALIIDVRGNPGGRGGLNEALCEYITDKPYRVFGRGDLKVSGSVKRLLGREAYVERLGEEAWKAPDGSLISDIIDFAKPEPNPLRFSGKVYCLAGAGTFSNGMAFASVIKDCQLGILVGEETGGVGSAYGDYITFRLPHSGFDLNISLKHIFRPSGIDDGRGILPDHEIRQTIEDTGAGRDTVLDFARRLVTSGSQ